jgi:hypothetical protein
MNRTISDLLINDLRHYLIMTQFIATIDWKLGKGNGKTVPVTDIGGP